MNFWRGEGICSAPVKVKIPIMQLWHNLGAIRHLVFDRSCRVASPLQQHLLNFSKILYFAAELLKVQQTLIPEEAIL